MPLKLDDADSWGDGMGNTASSKRRPYLSSVLKGENSQVIHLLFMLPAVGLEVSNIHSYLGSKYDLE